MLHVLNGDATLAVFPASLPGDRVVWRDIMVEGPAVDDGAARAAWLAPRLDVTPADYKRGWEEGQAALARAAGAHEVILWFEQDLFCAINLWFVAARLPETTPVSLIFPPLTDTFGGGLGALKAPDLAVLFERRRQLPASARAEAQALWRAYAGTDPNALARTEATLDFTRDAVRLHLGRFPSTTRGLDEIETTTMTTLAAGPRPFGELFRHVGQAPPHRRHGMGDVQYAAMLRDLNPLIAIDDSAAAFREWRLTLRPEGRAVLDGRLDGRSARGLDRWLGGVHLRPGEPGWRWSGTRVIRR